MTRLHLPLFALALLSIAAPAAYAGSSGGLYIGALAGAASSDDWDRIVGNANGIIGTDATAATSGSLGLSGALGYRLSPGLAVEVSYVDGGTSDVEFATVPALIEIHKRHAAISVLGILPVSEGIELYGRLGVAHWEMETDLTLAGVKSSDTISGNDLTYGAGLASELVSQLDLLADYQRIKMKVPSGNLSADYYLAGLRYRF